MFDRVAIVNRGEAATRFLHAVAELRHERGYPLVTIALYTEADERALFVREADESICLGPAATIEPTTGRRMSPYLDLGLLETALIAARADAVWVGWGFVAEDPEFAELCEKSGITFIGPTAESMRRLGDKLSAKHLAEACDIPVVPWSGGPLDNVDDAIRHAERIGYPVVIKAASGGGGRGIRIVEDPHDIDEAYHSARREASSAFGDDRVFLEAKVSGARHVEVQVAADVHGAVTAFGVRDCSVQRRNQKVLEESSSTVLDEAAEREIVDAAIRLCRAAGYRNVGTVEMLYVESQQRAYFMEVNTRLQVEHTVTEATTGIDLVKLQIELAAGATLPTTAVKRSGHAIEARLNAEDPGQQFAPAAGRLLAFHVANGPGLRVDTGLAAGDLVAPEFDSMIAKIVAWGRTRNEALARLHRSLSSSVFVIDGGTTNRAFLLGLLEHPSVLAGDVDTGWLDRAVAAGELLGQTHAAEALLLAAVEAYELEASEEQRHFFSTAARGRPELRDQSRATVSLTLFGVPYDLTVFRLDPVTYRIYHGDESVEVVVERRTRFECRLTTPCRSVTAVAVVDGPAHRIEIGSGSYRVVRGSAGMVRSPSSGVVVALHTAVGASVRAGEPLAVVEAMKLEMAIVAPFDARVLEVLVEPNRQVDAGDALVRLDVPLESTTAAAAPIEFNAHGFAGADVPTFEHVFGFLRNRLLGFDRDPRQWGAVRNVLDDLYRSVPADSPELLEAEDEVLDLFTEVVAISKRHQDRDRLIDDGTRPNQEHLFSFLRSPERAEEILPPQFLGALRALLGRYGVHHLDRSAELEEAMVRIYRAQLELNSEVSSVIAILDRRIRHRDNLGALDEADFAVRLDRLVAAAEGRFPSVADHARVTRHRYVDDPLLHAVRSRARSQIEQSLERMSAARAGTDRETAAAAVLSSPEDLRPLLGRWIRSGSEPKRRTALEMLIRRLYRIRDLTSVATGDDGVVTVRYAIDDRKVQVVAGAGHWSDLSSVVESVAESAAKVDATSDLIVDIVTWTDVDLEIGDIDTEIRSLMARRVGRRVHRLDVSVDVAALRAVAEADVLTHHLSYRETDDGVLVEEPLSRDLHPMVAKRLELWRLGNFQLERLPAADGVHLFRGVADENPHDERLFAVAEVHDLTPLPGDDGESATFPVLERTLLASGSAIRRVQVQRPQHERLLWNQISLFVRPMWSIRDDQLRSMLRRLAPAMQGLGLGHLLLRVHEPIDEGRTQDSVLHVSAPMAVGLAVGRTAPSEELIRPLTDYRQSVIRLQRRGAVAPYEVISLLTSPAASEADFPVGEFVEYDLDETSRLVEVQRPYGQNVANVVVGRIRNVDDAHPEGMTRVIIVGDAGRSMGSLAEPECRRVIAALDLAERLGVPVEWFAVSSGARVAMDSGVENMDWTAAVLRRIVERTQAGQEINIVTIGPNVGAQSYWNAEAAMLMHTRGIIIMAPESSMVLTGKHALDASGGVSAEDNVGIGGYERIMGPNGQAHFWAADLPAACSLLFAHYDHSYRTPGAPSIRRVDTADPADRDVTVSPHSAIAGSDFATVGDIFDVNHNPERKKPFDMRSLMRAVVDDDRIPVERWQRWHGAETAIVWDAHLGGFPVCLIGIESKNLPRTGMLPADGPEQWTSGTLFPQSSKKVARAVNAASGTRPVVVLGNLSGFDGSPESMRNLQLEYGAEIGRAIVNFRGPIVFCVVSRYHGGAFVVFSKALNPGLEVVAIEGSYASVLGGAPAASVVFAREVTHRMERDERVVRLRKEIDRSDEPHRAQLLAELEQLERSVRSEKQGELADEFDRIHSIERARDVGAVDDIIPAGELRPHLIRAIERGQKRQPSGTGIGVQATNKGGTTP